MNEDEIHFCLACKAEVDEPGVCEKCLCESPDVETLLDKVFEGY